MRKLWLEGTGVALDNDAKRRLKEDEDFRRQRDAAVRDLARTVATAALANAQVSEEFASELVEVAYERLGPLLEALADAGVVGIEEFDVAINEEDSTP